MVQVTGPMTCETCLVYNIAQNDSGCLSEVFFHFVHKQPNGPAESSVGERSQLGLN